MTIKEVTMYRVVCNDCGEGVDGDFYAWSEEGSAQTDAYDANWYVVDYNLHICPSCLHARRDRIFGVPFHRRGGSDE